MRSSRVGQGMLAALVMMFIWSGWLVVTKWGVSHSLSNLDIMLLRFGTATLIMLPYILKIGFKSVLEKFKMKTLIAGFACGTPYLWFSFIGMKSASTAHAGAIVNGSLPVFTVILMYIFTKNFPNIMQLIGIGFILLANVFLLYGEDFIGMSLSYAAFLAAGFSLSLYTVIAKNWEIKAKDILVVSPLLNCMVIFPIWYFSESNIASAPMNEIITQAAYQGVLVSVIALWLMSFSLKHITAYSFSFIMALVPINAALMAYAFLEEELTLSILLGITNCTIGIIIFNAQTVFQKIKGLLQKK